MSRDMQIFLCVVPYLFAVVIGIAYLPQALQENERLVGELANLKGEYQRLADKLKEKEQLLGEQKKLDKEIQKVRAAVPSTAEMDILLMDLEKLSNQAGTDLIAVEQPTMEKSKEKKGTLMDSILAEMGGGKSLAGEGSAQKQAQKPANQTAALTTPQKPDANKQAQTENDALGIQNIQRRVFVSGSYHQLVDFIKKLESYQRIVGIQDLIVAAPPDKEMEANKTVASDKAQSLELKRPVMTFVMNVYYLP